MEDFSLVYRLYFEDVYRYLCSMCRNAYDAEELTAETFFKALKNLDSFRGDCDIRLWLLKIAKNCYLSSVRKPRPEPVCQSLESAEGIPEQEVLSRMEADRLNLVIRSLPEPGKEVFMWRVWGGLGFREIGAKFGKTENWACVTYHRTRKEIKKRLEMSEYEK